MRMRRSSRLWTVTVTPALAAVAAWGWAMAAVADDWPQWQGPDRNAVSKETGLLKEWPKDGPPLAWKVKGLGGGDSAPSVAGGKLFGMSNRGDDEVVWACPRRTARSCGRRASGRPSSSACRSRRRGRAARRRSTASGSTSWAWAATWRASRSKDGKVLWQSASRRTSAGACRCGATASRRSSTATRSSAPPAARTRPSWPSTRRPARRSGRARCPAAAGRGLRLGPSRSTPPGSASTCSSPQGTLVGVAAADGKVLWRYDRPANGNGINCYHAALPRRPVFASSAYGAGGGLVKLARTGTASRPRRSTSPVDGEPPRRHDPPRRLPVRRPRRQRGRVPRLPRLQDRQGPLGRARGERRRRRARWRWPTAGSTTAPRPAPCS